MPPCRLRPMPHGHADHGLISCVGSDSVSSSCPVIDLQGRNELDQLVESGAVLVSNDALFDQLVQLIPALQINNWAAA